MLAAARALLGQIYLVNSTTFSFSLLHPFMVSPLFCFLFVEDETSTDARRSTSLSRFSPTLGEVDLRANLLHIIDSNTDLVLFVSRFSFPCFQGKLKSFSSLLASLSPSLSLSPPSQLPSLTTATFFFSFEQFIGARTLAKHVQVAMANGDYVLENSLREEIAVMR